MSAGEESGCADGSRQSIGEKEGGSSSVKQNHKKKTKRKGGKGKKKKGKKKNNNVTKENGESVTLESRISDTCTNKVESRTAAGWKCSCRQYEKVYSASEDGSFSESCSNEDGGDSGAMPSAVGGCTLSLLDSDKVLLLGGVNRMQKHTSLKYAHIFSRTTNKWTQISPRVTKTASGAPSVSDAQLYRSGHTANSIQVKGSSGARNVVVVFGGVNFQDEVVFNDVLVLDCDMMEWAGAKQTGDIPAARNSHTATLLNDADNSIVIFAGSSPEEGYRRDAYRLVISFGGDEKGENVCILVCICNAG